LIFRFSWEMNRKKGLWESADEICPFFFDFSVQLRTGKEKKFSIKKMLRPNFVFAKWLTQFAKEDIWGFCSLHGYEALIFFNRGRKFWFQFHKYRNLTAFYKSDWKKRLTKFAFDDWFSVWITANISDLWMLSGGCKFTVPFFLFGSERKYLETWFVKRLTKFAAPELNGLRIFQR